MNKQAKRQYGYSLAEVLVALAIFAVIFLAALTAYDRSNRVFRTGVESSNLQQNTRVAFDKLVSDLRMAGYDFDRDGIPTGTTVSGTNVYQQPDEQFEYIGPSAVTIRANFDYENENQPCTATLTDNCDNGREKSLESNQFPVVTTGNDEIVTYALVPDNQTAIPACDPATNCVQFYADTHLPRKSYPDPANGGLDENVVEITGVDLCNGGCNNPPYTLYRFTLDPTKSDFTGGNNVIRTPLASNIRSMTFTYFQNATGLDPLKDVTNTNDVSTGATINGNGQYLVANPLALIPERVIRAKVNSVRVTLIGMNESRDAAFTDTAEPVQGAPGFFEQYRKYRLETLVSPRNIQKRGMREQDASPPGAPNIGPYCTGYCAGVYLAWSAPVINPNQGAPDQYKVLFDEWGAPGYTCETTTFTNTFAYVFYQSTMPATPCKLDPTKQYKFAVVALNSYGSSPLAAWPNAIQPINTTQPPAPLLQGATTTLNGKVTLTWNRLPSPTATPAAGNYSCATPSTPPPAELQGYFVERQVHATGNWVVIPSMLPLNQITDASKITISSALDAVTYNDTTAENCVNYDYRVTAVEACYFNKDYNNPNTAVTCGGGNNCGQYGISAASNILPGYATTAIPPAAPSNLTVDQDLTNSPCALEICNVHMYFPPVKLDSATPTPNPITITEYDVYRQKIDPSAIPITSAFALASKLINPPLNSTTGSPAFGQIEYTDNGIDVSSNKSYNYFVVAHTQCPTTPIPSPTPPLASGDSAPSPTRPYPCAFPPAAVASPLITSAGAFDGDGTAANPWKIPTGTTASATVGIKDGSQVARVVGREYTGTILNWQAQCPTAPCTSTNYPTATAIAAPATFSWSLGHNNTERLDVAVVQTVNSGPPATGGCVLQSSVYFEDEPQNCCLIPSSVSGSGVLQYSATQQYVDFVLKNVCGSTLTINSLSFVVNGTFMPANEQLMRVDFPTTGTNTCPDPSGPAGSMSKCVDVDYTVNGKGLALPNKSSSPTTMTINVTSLPAGVATVPANSPNGTYIIRIAFNNKTSNQTAPITSMSVTYTESGNSSSSPACPIE